MSDNTTIAWTDATWAPIVGCSRVSSGCKSCYAIRAAHRMAGNPNPKIASVYQGLTARHQNGQLDWTGEVRCLPDRLDWPLHWRKPRRVFVCSVADLFHDQVSDEFIAAVFGIMAACPQHTFQVLTKRPERMCQWFTDLESRARHAAKVFPDDSLGWRRRHTLRAAAIGQTGVALPGISDPEIWPLSNVWIGVSCENQKAADERIPLLLQVPAAVRFVSLEPLLGPIRFQAGWLDGTCDHPCSSYLAYGDSCACTTGRGPNTQINWVIVGGESGPGYRLMDPDWARSLRDQCVATGAAFFWKQTSGPRPGTGDELDGVKWHQFPTAAQ